MTDRCSTVARAPWASLAGTLAALLLLPTLASAQLSTTRGFSLGAQLQGTALSIEGGDANSGGGLGVRAGYGFNRIITGFIQIDGSQVDITAGNLVVGQWALAHADIGARFHLANSLRRWVPYLEAAVGARTVSVDDAVIEGDRFDKVSFNGGAFTLGGGLSVHFNPKWALDVSLKVSSGQFSELDVGNASLRNLDIDATSSRFGVGVVWWP